MSEQVEVVGLMRFNVVLDSSKSAAWRIGKGESLDNIVKIVLAPRRIESRLRLAEAMPIASLARQTNRDFRLCILISTLLQPAYTEDLAALALRYPFITIVNVAPSDDLRRVCSGLIVAGKPCITFRLDDDDAVGPEFIADLRMAARPENEERIISFTNGVQMQRRGRVLEFQQLQYVKNAFGISFYSKTGATIFDQGPHHNFDETRMVCISRPRAWVRSIHAGSDSISKFKPGWETWSARPKQASAHLPEYHGIDFNRIAADLAPFDWKYHARRWLRWQHQKVKDRVESSGG